MGKKFLILFLILFSFVAARGQDYFPKGSMWHYDVPPLIAPPYYSYTTIVSLGDSIFNNDTLTYLSGGVSCGPMNRLIKQIGNKIYQLNECDSSYTLLYNFGALLGDTIEIIADKCNTLGLGTDTVLLLIDSINIININGNNLQHFFTSQINWSSNWQFFGNIIENIGNTYAFFPQWGACDPFGGPLRCYNDSVIGEYNTGLHNGVCDTTYYGVGVMEFFLNESISIYPNPTSGRLYIETKNQFESVEIFRVNGQKLISTKQKEIDLSAFSKGIYLLKISFEKGIVYRKIIKK